MFRVAELGSVPTGAIMLCLPNKLLMFVCFDGLRGKCVGCAYVTIVSIHSTNGPTIIYLLA